LGYQVPPGISDATVPNPIFNLTPSATVDEGNNWINMSWGPLAMTNPTVTGTDGNYGSGALLGNYALSPTSSAIDYVPTSLLTDPYNLIGPAPGTDFFGNPRPDPANPNHFDVGAVEYQFATPTYTVSPLALAFGNRLIGTTSAAQSVTITNTSTNGAFLTVNAPTRGGANPLQWNAPTTNCPANLAPGNSCTASIAFNPTTTGAKSANLQINVGAPASPTQTSVALTGTGTQGAVSFSAPSPTLVTGTTSPHSGTVTVTNTGTAPVTLTAAPTATKVSGAASSSFGVTGGTCTNGFTINPGGGTCTIVVTYTPGSGGTTTATAHVNISDTGVASGGGTATQSSANFSAN